MPPWEFDVMKISQSGLELICKFEGFEAKAYQDAVGVWTIGYGHTAMAGLPDVKRGDKITMKQAQDILATDVRKFELAVKSKLTRAPTQAQFDAMVSLCFDIGQLRQVIGAQAFQRRKLRQGRCVVRSLEQGEGQGTARTHLAAGGRGQSLSCCVT
jgi:GH24 family phage-related lysozyme (muramidase)